MEPSLHSPELPMRTGAPRCLMALVVVLVGSVACGGGGGGPVTIEPDPTQPLATATIGPGGGRVEVTAGPHAGVAVNVRAGVLAADTQFRIRLVTDESVVPTLFPVYAFEPADRVFPPDGVAVTVLAAGQFFFDAEQGVTQLAMFSRPGNTGALEVMPATVVNELARTATASPTRLGRFFASDGNMHRLFTQQLALLDPAVPTAIANVFGVEITIANGAQSQMLGRGSLADFWSSPATENVLILHGLAGSPLDFRGPFDLIQSLPPSVHNVVVAVYPSALGVAANANALYDLIRANQQPGFGCTIIGHSLGGMIGRYLLEQAANDPARPGIQAGDLPMSDVVPVLFLMGTPNAGSNVAGQLFAALLPNLPPQDARFVRAGLDLLEGANTFMAQQNAAYVDNPTVYHTVCGDFGNGTDGIVSVASATALPLTSPEAELLLPVGHFDLHRGAATNGVAAWIAARLP